MSFLKNILDVTVQAAKALASLSVVVHVDKHLVEITQLGFMALKKIVKAKYEVVQEIDIDESIISVKIYKFFLTHTIEISNAAVLVDGDVVRVGAQLTRSVPIALQGIVGEVVAFFVNCVLGFTGNPASVVIRDNIVSYHVPTIQLGLLTQLTLDYGVQNISLDIYAEHGCVFVRYPDNMRVNPEITNIVDGFLSGVGGRLQIE